MPQRVLLNREHFRKLVAGRVVQIDYNTEIALEEIPHLQMILAVADAIDSGYRAAPRDPVQAREFLPTEHQRRPKT